MENTWTMEDAKNDFTAIAKAAYGGKPQYVTSHSHPDLVITTKNRDKNLEEEEKEENRRFIEFLMSGPKGDIFPEGYETPDISTGDVKF